MKKWVYVLFFFLFLNSTFSYSYNVEKRKLDKGLIYYNFKGEYKDKKYDIYILKIDPSYFSFELLMSSKLNINPLSLKEWSKKYNLVAVINASMFWKDKSTSTGYMKNQDYVNQKIIHKRFGGFLVFNPKQKNIPQVAIIEKDYTKNWKEILTKYDTVIQDYRMIGKNRKNLWHIDNNTHSVSAIGIDEMDMVQFIFSYLPLSIHDLNEILLTLPIKIKSCLFTEGGSTCGMYLRYKNFEKNLNGYSKMDIFHKNKNSPVIPNIIGIIKKAN